MMKNGDNCVFCGRAVRRSTCFPCELRAIREKAEAKLKIHKLEEKPK